ncbi:substrate-binding domain-containing protein [Oscillatoria amoena NRMC-F 0135]|nr:substrate-binding domain-containing protein [Oscillatoria laete-virens]MDL5049123.1 substrate-binding domain-containing protein [Oscillatoria amoena NRMC-F 0135]MDL5053993.1 substrate-binding domain-containing protein [Oscillatoria laete-virens NRMC-F 0139]
MKPFFARFFASILLVGLLLAACSPAKETDDSASPSPSKKIQIAVIPKGTTHEFWKSIHAGAKQAAKELSSPEKSVEIIWQGPLKEDDREQQVQVVESFLSRGVQGMVLAPLDAKALVAPAEQVISAGIPVVIFDSDLDSDRPASTVATDNYKGGQMAARELGKLLDGKGDIAVLRYAVGSASTEAREKGFFDVIAAEFPQIKIVSGDQYAGPTRETAYQASQNLLSRHGKSIVGIYTPNESSTAGMILALRDAGRSGGKIRHVGFDSGELLVDALQKGDVQALVVQDPFKMGYLAVKTMNAVINGEPVEKRIDTAVVLITPENLSTPEIQALLNPSGDR